MATYEKSCLNSANNGAGFVGHTGILPKKCNAINWLSGLGCPFRDCKLRGIEISLRYALSQGQGRNVVTRLARVSGRRFGMSPPQVGFFGSPGGHSMS
jgi:hypothetical protein